MNIERILRLADTIERSAIPDLTFDMREFCQQDYDNEDEDGHVCGTIACIAGWAVVDSLIAEGESAKHAVEKLQHIHVYGSSISSRAAQWLQLNTRTACELFLPEGVDEMEDVTPAMAASVLRHLAKTGGVEWRGHE